MSTKNYDLAILTDNDEEAGTSGEVWLKFDGSRGSTGWFPFLEPDEPPGRRHFVPGRVDFGSLGSVDLGEPQACAMELRGDAGESWFPRSVELIDGPISYTWEFSVRMRPGERVVRDAPNRDETLRFDRIGPSAYDRSVAEARRVLTDAVNKWRENDPSAPSPDDILDAILSIFRMRD